MSLPAYWFEKINEVINTPKGNRAWRVNFEGTYIDELFDHYKDSVSQNDLLEVEHLMEKLREYIQRNCTSKFQTKEYARKLVSDLKAVLGHDSIH